MREDVAEELKAPVAGEKDLAKLRKQRKSGPGRIY